MWDSTPTRSKILHHGDTEDTEICCLFSVLSVSPWLFSKETPVLAHSMQARKSVNGFFAICHLPFSKEEVSIAKNRE